MQLSKSRKASLTSFVAYSVLDPQGDWKGCGRRKRLEGVLLLVALSEVRPDGGTDGARRNSAMSGIVSSLVQGSNSNRR